MAQPRYFPLWSASLALPSSSLPTLVRHKGLSLGSEVPGARHLLQDSQVTLEPIALTDSLPPISCLLGPRGQVFMNGLANVAKKALLSLLLPSGTTSSPSRFILFKVDSSAPSLANPFDLPLPAKKHPLASKDPASPRLPSHIIIFLSSNARSLLYIGCRNREAYPPGIFQPLSHYSSEIHAISSFILSSSSTLPPTPPPSQGEGSSSSATTTPAPSIQVASAFHLLHPAKPSKKQSVTSSRLKRSTHSSFSSSSSSQASSAMLTSPKRIKRSTTLPVMADKSNPLSTPTRPKIKKSGSEIDMAKLKRYKSMDAETRQKKKKALEDYNIPRIQKCIDRVLTKKCKLTPSDSMYSALRGKMLGGVYTDLYNTIQTHKLTEKETLQFLSKFL
ncbi:MAG: hypothetical protein DHS80DRAFT_33618 [Piptocephalis tieghemiana]|nr:MAG: hypothetical protein DHS80DRAFT_33618 [Piptocephalis tieghemiana]